MAYSINPILHHLEDKSGLRKVQILVIYNRIKCIYPTVIKLATDQWDGKVINHPNKVAHNALLQKTITEIETRIITRLREGDISKEELFVIVKGEQKKESKSIIKYVETICVKLKGKLSHGRLKHIMSIAGKIDKFRPGITFRQINTHLLNDFEASLRNNGLDGNTVQTNMKIFHSILNRAAADKLINKTQYEAYKMPKYVQKLPEYLTEQELAKVHDLVKTIQKKGHKIAGNYFLLSCYAGYRIGDARRFDFAKMVQDEMIVLRTGKNNTIVSIPIHSRLKDILLFAKDQKFALSQEKAREYVKDICSLAGIKKHVKFHTARHSFAMLLRKNGFNLDEIAHFLGDSRDVARVYGRIHDETLHAKIKAKLG